MERKALLRKVEKKIRKVAVAARGKRKTNNVCNNNKSVENMGNASPKISYIYRPLPHATKLEDVVASHSVLKVR